VDSDLKGVESHGCCRLPSYLQQIAEGIINPKAEPSCEAIAGAQILRIDGQRGFGIPAMERALEALSEAVEDTALAAAGIVNVAHTGHTATLLDNGRVLVAGGSTRSAELFNPSTGAFTATEKLSTARTGHTATLLENSQVLAAGGFNGMPLSLDSLNSAELFGPAGASEGAIVTIINTLLLD